MVAASESFTVQRVSRGWLYRAWGLTAAAVANAIAAFLGNETGIAAPGMFRYEVRDRASGCVLKVVDEGFGDEGGVASLLRRDLESVPSDQFGGTWGFTC